MKSKISVKPSEAKGNSAVFRVRKADFNNSVRSPIDQIFFLQRTIGNQAVQGLFKCGAIQAKLKIGQPGDIYEQEADRVADEVMRMPEPRPQRQVEPEEEEETLQPKPLVSQITPLAQVQRQEEPEEEEEEEETLQAKSLGEQITPLVQRQVEEEEEEELLQTKALSEQITPLVQRQEEEGQEEEEEELLMAKDISGRAQQITDDLHIRLNLSKGGGQPLQETDRNFMERRLGVDFSGVRVHTDSEAIHMSRELNAEAFIYGKDIYFGTGKYSPGTSSGRRLLAHELTHLVRQSGIQVQHHVVEKEKLIQTKAEGSRVQRRVKEEREEEKFPLTMGVTTVLYFDYNSTKLLDRFRSDLDRAYKEIKQYFDFPHPEIKTTWKKKQRVRILGFASKEGSYAHNKRLSQRRADQVKKWLEEKGLPPDKLKPEGMGVSLLAERRAPEAYWRDRKVVFVAHPPIPLIPLGFEPTPLEFRLTDEQVNERIKKGYAGNKRYELWSRASEYATWDILAPYTLEVASTPGMPGGKIIKIGDKSWSLKQALEKEVPMVERNLRQILWKTRVIHMRWRLQSQKPSTELRK